MSRDKPSGKYRLPDGSIVVEVDFALRTKFVTYGPEDLWWLVAGGQRVVHELREIHFFIMEDPFFLKFNRDFGPMILDSRRITTSTFV